MSESSGPQDASHFTATGGCICGQVRYGLIGPLPSVGFCHCSQCRKASGTGSNAVMNVRGEAGLPLLEKVLADDELGTGDEATYALGFQHGEKALALLEKSFLSGLASLLLMANWPTGPQPQMAIVSPGWMLQYSAAM